MTRDSRLKTPDSRLQTPDSRRWLTLGKLRVGFAAFAILFATAVFVHAANLAEHKASIDEARDFVREMIIEVAQAQAGIAEFDHGPEDTAELRDIIPLVVRIDAGYGTAEVWNHWLHNRLKDFDEATNLQEQALILTEIEERLTAISWSLGEYEQAEKRSRTKDEEKQKLADILAREEYRKPAEPEESLLERWWAKISEWFSGLFPESGPSLGTPGAGALVPLLQAGLIVAVAALVVFGIFKLVPLLFPELRRRKKEKRPERIVLGEAIGADQSADKLFEEAERMAGAGDLRGAIRKGYIALLCELGDRKIIGLAHHKTNRDYLKDVRKNGELHTTMNGITNTFERHWYGVEQGDERSWSEFREGYFSALRQT